VRPLTTLSSPFADSQMANPHMTSAGPARMSIAHRRGGRDPWPDRRSRSPRTRFPWPTRRSGREISRQLPAGHTVGCRWRRALGRPRPISEKSFLVSMAILIASTAVVTFGSDRSTRPSRTTRPQIVRSGVATGSTTEQPHPWQRHQLRPNGRPYRPGAPVHNHAQTGIPAPRCAARVRRTLRNKNDLTGELCG
jgi:hypothetical protein